METFLFFILFFIFIFILTISSVVNIICKYYDFKNVFKIQRINIKVYEFAKTGVIIFGLFFILCILDKLLSLILYLIIF